MDSSEATTVLVRAITPYVGNLARYTVDTHAAKLALGNGPLTDEQLEALIARLGSGLRIFVGRDKSMRAIDEMREALAAAKGARS
jgi:hypothetical protein